MQQSPNSLAGRAPPLNPSAVRAPAALTSPPSHRPATAPQAGKQPHNVPSPAGDSPAAETPSPPRPKFRFQGVQDGQGRPHGLGILHTGALYYKGNFFHGKFHGVGFLRRYAPPGSAAEAAASSEAATPALRPGSASLGSSQQRHADPESGPANTSFTSPRGARGDAASPTGGAVPTRGNQLAVWTYYGDFFDGKRHGFGKIRFHSTGESYEGEWDKDCMQGEGVYVIPTTGTYTGDMRGNRRHGIGTMLYIDGSGYRGHWFQDVIHGGGRLVEAGGVYYDGHWHRGVMNGTFHLTKPSGSVYKCRYLDGRQVTKECIKSRDLFKRIFESAPEHSVEELLAQVFANRPSAFREDGGEGAQPTPTAAAATGPADRAVQARRRLSAVNLDRPQTAPRAGRPADAPGAEATGGDDEGKLNLQVEDVDFDDTPVHAALTKNLSFAKPLDEVRQMLTPSARGSSMRRPFSADAAHANTSPKVHEGSDDEEGQSLGAGSPASPARNFAPMTGKTTGVDILDQYHVSPSATMTSPGSASHDASAATSPNNNASNGALDAMSARSQETIDRLAAALAEESKSLPAAPAVPGAAGGAPPTAPGAPNGGGDADEVGMADDDFYAHMTRKRSMADFDRRAKVGLERALSIRTPKAAPAPTPRAAGAAPTPKARAQPNPAGDQQPKHTPPRYLEGIPITADSFVFNNDSVTSPLYTVPQGTPAHGPDYNASLGPGALTQSFVSPRQGAESTPMGTSAKASSSFYNFNLDMTAAPSAAGRPPRVSTAHALGSSRRPSAREASTEEASSLLVVPPALRPREPSSANYECDEAPALNSTMNSLGLMMSSDGGSEDYSTSPVAGTTSPKLPSAPPSSALLQQLARLNSMSPGDRDAEDGESPDNGLASMKSGDGRPNDGVARATAALRVQRASSMLSATSSGAADADGASPKFGRRAHTSQSQ